MYIVISSLKVGKRYTKGHDYSVHVALDVVVAGFENEPGNSFPINPTENNTLSLFSIENYTEP